MTDPKTLAGHVTTVMLKRSPDLPPEKAAAKVKSAFGWWLACFGFAALAAFLCWRLIEALTHGTNIPTILSLALVGLPAVISLFCANQASGEVTKAFMDLLRQLVGLGRTAAGKDSAP